MEGDADGESPVIDQHDRRDPTSRNGRIPGLDGLRGLAALTVFVSHMSNNHLFLWPGADLSGIGKPAVYLFFVLSAFLLTSQLWNWEPQQLRTPRCWLGYLVGRIFRIWPLFLLYVGASYVTTQLGGRFLDGDGIPERYGLAQVIDALLLRRVTGSILWTILVEFKFYLLLPLLILGLALGLRKAKGPCLALLGASAAAALCFIPHELLHGTPIPYLGIFLAGMWAALIHHTLASQPKQRWQRYFELAAWLSAALFVALIPSVASLLVGAPVPPEYLREAYGSFSLLWTTLILGMLHGTGRMRRLLESKALVHLGTISYGLYLWHLSVLKVLVWPRIPLPMGVKAWLALPMALGLAALSFHLIESRALAYGARLRRSLTRKPASAPVAS